MFDYCCDHATIVARRQPLFSLIEAALPGCSDDGGPRASDFNNLEVIDPQATPA
jgi:hypothetical protein